MLNIAVEGCCHGELDTIYATITSGSASCPHPVDLLLICGDFQCVRDAYDLDCVAVPKKYAHLNTFHHYVTGEKVAPVMTIFVGGNHEASNILHELYYGGWVAPNIYFLGFAGVVWYKGVRIGGVSGIYNHHHYHLGHSERIPYSYEMLKSVYHIRELEVYRMMHLLLGRSPIDILLSHDWPQGIWEYGDKRSLLRTKPFLREDMESGRLGCPPFMHLLQYLQPRFWFAAHLHVKFAAIYPHSHSHPEQASEATIETDSLEASAAAVVLCGVSESERGEHSSSSNGNSSSQSRTTSTRFLALDKVIPGRDFLQFLKVPQQSTRYPYSDKLEFDPEWLAVVKATHRLLSALPGRVSMPRQVNPPTDQDIETVTAQLVAAFGSCCIPEIGPTPLPDPRRTQSEGNAQTDALLAALGLPHIWTVPVPALEISNSNSQSSYSNSSNYNIGMTDVAEMPPRPPGEPPAASSLATQPTHENNNGTVAAVDNNEIDIDDI